MPTAGLCCASGKVQLPAMKTPPEPLNGLLIGTDPDSNLFLKSMEHSVPRFQMTSFRATKIVDNAPVNGQQFKSTFKIQCQIYHYVSSLLPISYNLLNSLFARRIASDLDDLLNEHNELLKMSKS